MSHRYEQRLFERACLKLSLERALLQGDFGAARSGEQDRGGRGSSSRLSRSELDELLRYGAYGVLRGDDEAARTFCDADIDKLLEESVEVTYGDGPCAVVGGGPPGTECGGGAAGGSLFSRASFVAAGAGGGGGGGVEELSLDDPDFWAKMQRMQRPEGAAGAAAGAAGEEVAATAGRRTRSGNPACAGAAASRGGRRQRARREAAAAAGVVPAGVAPADVAAQEEEEERGGRAEAATDAGKAGRRRRCGACSGCVSANCGECAACRSMVCFGGSGASRQACARRRCLQPRPILPPPVRPPAPLSPAQPSRGPLELGDYVLVDDAEHGELLFFVFRHVQETGPETCPRHAHRRAALPRLPLRRQAGRAARRPRGQGGSAEM